MAWQTIAKFMMIFGLVLFVLGGILYILTRLGFNGLWGDIFIKKGNFTFFFPVATCLVISVILTLLFNIFFRK